MANQISYVLRAAFLVVSLLLFISLTIGKGYPFPVPRPGYHRQPAGFSYKSRRRGDALQAAPQAIPLQPRPRDRLIFGRIVGEGVIGSPCCAVREDRVDCFIRNRDSNLLHGIVSLGDNAVWTSLDLFVVGDVECLIRNNGEIEVLAVNRRQQLLTRTLKEDGWTRWTSTAAVYLREKPSCVTRSTRYIDCFFRGLDNSAYRLGSIDGIWANAIEPLGGILMRPNSCISSGEDSVTCFSIGVDCRLQVYDWNALENSGSWKSMHGRFMKGTPYLVSHDGHSLDVFMSDSHDTLLWKEVDIEGTERQWKRVGHGLGFQPSCLSINNGMMLCFFVQSDASFAMHSWDGMQWRPATVINGRFVGTPSCHEIQKGIIVCYVISMSTIHEFTFDVHDWSYSTPIFKRLRSV